MGQFTNALPAYDEGDTQEVKMCIRDRGRTGNSLGLFGSANALATGLPDTCRRSFPTVCELDVYKRQVYLHHVLPVDAE